TAPKKATESQITPIAPTKEPPRTTMIIRWRRRYAGQWKSRVKLRARRSASGDLSRGASPSRSRLSAFALSFARHFARTELGSLRGASPSRSRLGELASSSKTPPAKDLITITAPFGHAQSKRRDAISIHQRSDSYPSLFP